MPKIWRQGTVDQINLGNRPCSYGVLQPGPHVKDGIPLIRVGDIQDGRGIDKNIKKINPKIAGKYLRTKLQGGEVLITLVGAIGRTAVVPKSLSGANTARAVGVIALSEAVNQHWAELCFRNPAKIKEMTGKAHEVARKTLNLEDVRTAIVALPSRNEQDQIVDKVALRFALINQIEKEVDNNLKRAERLRQSILKKAFSGKLISHGHNVDPAANPLKRSA